MSLPLALSVLGNLVVGLFVLVCLALMLIVLLQKGRGGGMAAAFGGSGASSLLGTKTGDFLTWVTICLVALFLVLAVLMGKFMRPTGVATPTLGTAGTSTQTPTAGSEQAAPVQEGQPEAAPAAGEPAQAPAGAAAETTTQPETPAEAPAQP
jgi:preprotein translocase subunit SecG